MGKFGKKNFDSDVVKNIVIIVLTILCFLLGNERMELKFQLQFRLDVALYVVPLLVIGYYIRSCLNDYKRFLKWYVAIPMLGISLYFSKIGYQNSIVSQDVKPIGYYFLGLIGIYQSFYFAMFICKHTKKISEFFSFIGKYTFEIMCFHFLVFKTLDFVFYAINGDKDVTILSAFPHTYNLSYIYVFFGCLLPAIFKSFLDNIKKNIVLGFNAKSYL